MHRIVRRLSARQSRPHGQVERFAAGAENAEPTRAAGRASGIDIHQVDLADAELVALQPVGGQIGPHGDQDDDDGKGDPGPVHAAAQAAEEEVVARPDQEDIHDHQQGHRGERHEMDPRGTSSALRNWPARSVKP